MRGPHKFFYGNSGAEAIECALKVARYHTGRQQVIAFLRSISRAHHGRAVSHRFEAAAEDGASRRWCRV
jgi:4-aminobutyrate aminotransferase